MASLDERISIMGKSVFLLIGCILASAYYFTASDNTATLTARITELEAKTTEAEKKLEAVKKRSSNKVKFQEEMEKVSQTFRAALEFLPKELDVQDLYRKIYSEARTAGVELSKFTPKESISKDFYDEIPMEIQVRGSYPQIVAFLSYVSKLPRIVNINNVEMGTPQFVDGYPMLRMTGSLVGYRYKEGK